MALKQYDTRGLTASLVVPLSPAELSRLQADCDAQGQDVHGVRMTDPLAIHVRRRLGLTDPPEGEAPAVTRARSRAQQQRHPDPF